jgi:hypothetical protein
MFNIFRNKSRRAERPMLFHVTHAKAGSSWIYRILKKSFGDAVYKRTGVETQGLECQPGGVYGAMFLTYEEFCSIGFSKEQPHFYVIRDIRDTLVSLYFSYRYSHATSRNDLLSLREKLSTMSEAEGLLYVFRSNGPILATAQLSWIRSGAPIYRYEDMFESNGAMLVEILDEIGFHYKEKRLRAAIEQFSFEKQYDRKPGEVDISSHGRTGLPGDWRNHISPEIERCIEEEFTEVLSEARYL